MPDFLFDLPLLITGPAIIGLLCLYAVIGMKVMRRWVMPRLRVQVADSEFSGAMVQTIMVFYGLAAALIAVNVSQTSSDVSRIVSGEAAALGALYRDVSCYPESARQPLQTVLRDYADDIIDNAWPLQRQGKMPGGGVALMNRFQTILTGFEPATEGQKLLHAETLRAYNQLLHSRNLRLDAVKTGLPGVMWGVIIAGAFIGLSASFFFRVEETRLHMILVLLLSVFIGLVIFMVAALDRPFRGDLGLTSEPYQLIRERLMKSDS